MFQYIELKENLVQKDSVELLVLKNAIKLAKGSLNNIFKTRLTKILSEQLIHDRTYIS